LFFSVRYKNITSSNARTSIDAANGLNLIEETNYV
jgi:hypothetical protein